MSQQMVSESPRMSDSWVQLPGDHCKSWMVSYVAASMMFENMDWPVFKIVLTNMCVFMCFEKIPQA